MKVVELVKLPFKLASFEVSSLEFANKKLYLSTIGGDLVELKITGNEYKVNSKRINGVVSIPNKQNSLWFLSGKLPYIITGGENGVVCLIDSRTNELLDTWAIGLVIHSVTATQVSEHFLIAAGCEGGSLKIRRDWDSVMNLSIGSSPITHIEFTKQGTGLICCTQDGVVCTVDAIEGGFQKGYPVDLKPKIPLSVDMSADDKFGIIVLDNRKLMMIDTKTFDLDFTHHDVAQKHWRKLRTRFAVNYSSADDPTDKGVLFLPVFWHSGGDSIVFADTRGVLHLWKSKF